MEDINDNAPVFEEAEYRSEVKESVAVGSTVTTVRATDLDTGEQICTFKKYDSFKTSLQIHNLVILPFLNYRYKMFSIFRFFIKINFTLLIIAVCEICICIL